MRVNLWGRNIKRPLDSNTSIVFCRSEIKVWATGLVSCQLSQNVYSNVKMRDIKEHNMLSDIFFGSAAIFTAVADVRWHSNSGFRI